MGIWNLLLKLSGWSVEAKVKFIDKCVICVAPHTSNWDFIIGFAAYRSLGRQANFLMKKFWFFFPLKYLLRSLGGIPVDRRRKRRKDMHELSERRLKNSSIVESVIEKFKKSRYLNLAITPEGTRSNNSEWKTGFLSISLEADVPILLAGLNYSAKKIIFDSYFIPGPDIKQDLDNVKRFYSDKHNWAKYPEKFNI